MSGKALQALSEAVREERHKRAAGMETDGETEDDQEDDD